MSRAQIETYNVPPAIADAYKTMATATGVEGVSPVYMGAGAIVASGVLLFAWGRCSGSKPTKASSGRGSKKSKAKSKSASSTANGSAHKNGGSGKGGGAASGGGAMVNGGAGARGLPGKGGGGEAPPAVIKAKAAKKPAKAAQPQAKGKGKGKAVPEAPPVITVRRGG